MDNPAWRLPALAVSAGLISSCFTYGLIRLNARLRLTAAPRGDRWHSEPTPNSGGVAIFLSCAVLYLLAFRGDYPAVALGAAGMFLIGFLDDRLQLRPWTKLAAQCAIAGMVVSSGVVFPATAWTWANVAFSFLWIVGITNAFNLIDNMDGLCAGVSIIICAFRICALVMTGHWADAQLMTVVAAAFAGFLVFNYNPARIFMGDCGSMLAGFSLSALAIAGPEAHTKAFAAGFFYPTLTFTYPIFDTLLVSVLRKAAGRPISVGGRDHSSHRLAYLGIGERQAVWILWGLTGLGSAVGLMTRAMPLEVIAAAALLAASLAMFGIFLSTLPPYQVPGHSPLLRPPLGRYVPTLRAGIILIVDSLVAGIALFIAFLIRYESDIPPEQIHNLIVSLPVVMLCHCMISGMYRSFDVSWQWFTFEDAMHFSRTILLGAALSWFIMWVAGVKFYPRGVVVLYGVLCMVLSVGMRKSLAALHDLFHKPGKQRDRVAIFGASAEGEMLATLLHKHTALNVTPVLFLDYDRAKHGMRIHGIPVRCCETSLRDLAVEFRLTSILMAGPFDRQRHAILTRHCLEAGVQLCTLDITISDLTPLAASRA